MMRDPEGFAQSLLSSFEFSNGNEPNSLASGSTIANITTNSNSSLFQAEEQAPVVPEKQLSASARIPRKPIESTISMSKSNDNIAKPSSIPDIPAQTGDKVSASRPARMEASDFDKMLASTETKKLTSTPERMRVIEVKKPQAIRLQAKSPIIEREEPVMFMDEDGEMKVKPIEPYWEFLKTTGPEDLNPRTVKERKPAPKVPDDDDEDDDLLFDRPKPKKEQEMSLADFLKSTAPPTPQETPPAKRTGLNRFFNRLTGGNSEWGSLGRLNRPSNPNSLSTTPKMSRMSVSQDVLNTSSSNVTKSVPELNKPRKSGFNADGLPTTPSTIMSELSEPKQEAVSRFSNARDSLPRSPSNTESHSIQKRTSAMSLQEVVDDLRKIDPQFDAAVNSLPEYEEEVVIDQESEIIEYSDVTMQTDPIVVSQSHATTITDSPDMKHVYLQVDSRPLTLDTSIQTNPMDASHVEIQTEQLGIDVASSPHIKIADPPLLQHAEIQTSSSLVDAETQVELESHIESSPDKQELLLRAVADNLAREIVLDAMKSLNDTTEASTQCGDSNVDAVTSPIPAPISEDQLVQTENRVRESPSHLSMVSRGEQTDVDEDNVSHTTGTRDTPRMMMDGFSDFQSESEDYDMNPVNMALIAENTRLHQEVTALKLALTTERSKAEQMKILKDAAEARFEQLARMAHKKLSQSSPSSSRK